ncbi:MAG: YihA family ribosome biogenesis GTP-binding protein [Candidatus Omnitrophota bacterium]|jgi:GTP-binding protein|nr:MAG: YihA family ribosome biogenesis GTP-binding protein [Candidatus Omnitrophota bacterium]
MLNEQTNPSSARPESEYRVVEASFVISAPNLKLCPDSSLPEIAVVGRSNVGKSSLINFLCNRKNLAKTSGAPGKTRLINYFLLRIEPGNVHLHLVDLPGFGYSKADKSTKEHWGKSLEEFLRKRRELQGILQLIDSRHEPTALDLQMREWIVHRKLPAITILTKTDKLARSAVARTRNQTIHIMKLQPEEPCILSSVLKKTGQAEITTAILSLLHKQESN